MESSKERVSTLSAVEMSLQVTLYNNKKYIMMESKFAENGIIFLCGMFFSGNYENNERHGEGFLDKEDGEKRNENWKKGKLVNFTVVT